ncbi:MAG: ABC transporter ATP-binding protein [Deltaproteobacteria bacterium]
MSDLIKLEDLVIGYEKNGITGPLNLSIKKDQFWGIIGPNGGGKSTLLKTLTGLIPPVSGNVRAEKELIFGYVPQKEGFDPIYPISVNEVVSMGRYSRVSAGKKLNKADKESVSKAMNKVGIFHLKDRPYRSLSGGERQRTLLARAVAGEPDILVLDEPTAFVDIKGEAQMMDLVRNIKTENRLAILMVSHFLNTVMKYSDHMILIDKDRGLFQAGIKTDMLESVSVLRFFGKNPGMEQID